MVVGQYFLEQNPKFQFTLGEKYLTWGGVVDQGPQP